MSILTLDGFTNFFKYYKGEPHQLAGITELYEKLPPSLKAENSAWIRTYRTPIVPEGVTVSNPLDVPYQSQHDNASGTGYRECFSSSCAMVAMYYDKVKNDDEYNLIRERYGDSTDAQAQVRALRSLGLEATFITNATTDMLKEQIDAGRPTPCGWLHKGHVSSPSGGGHYSVVIGYTDSAWIQNDPNGEAYLVEGGYDNYDQGKHVHYSFKNWNPRWVVEGEGSGWMLDIRDPAKK